jgi:hypothetical protein
MPLKDVYRPRLGVGVDAGALARAFGWQKPATPNNVA